MYGYNITKFGGLHMKINITKKQYRLLLDMVYAGNIMINGIRNQDELIKEYEDLEQYVFSFSKDFGIEGLVEYDNEFKEYMPTREFDESNINDFVNEYDDYVFWQELAGNLARRDVFKEFNGTINEDNSEDALKRQFEVENNYEEEFINNGLNNIRIVEGKL